MSEHSRKVKLCTEDLTREAVILRHGRVHLTEDSEACAVGGYCLGTASGMIRWVVGARRIGHSEDPEKLKQLFAHTLEGVEAAVVIHSDSDELLFIGKLVAVFVRYINACKLPEPCLFVAEVVVSCEDLEH